MKLEIGLVSVLLAATCLALPRSPSQEAPRALRVGTYDSRAVAVAYAPSRFNPVGERMREHSAAKAAGDSARVRELEAWGERHQRDLHRQGFGRVPVDDLLAHVAERLPEVARRARVDVIVMRCDWTASGVEVVDVTHELVQLYEPSQKTLETVAEVLKHEPLPLDEIERGHEH